MFTSSALFERSAFILHAAGCRHSSVLQHGAWRRLGYWGVGGSLNGVVQGRMMEEVGGDGGGVGIGVGGDRGEVRLIKSIEDEFTSRSF